VLTLADLFRLDGTRQKKRVRQPHSTADRHRKKALNDGEYIMEEGGGGRANYSVHFNLPDTGEYGEDPSSVETMLGITLSNTCTVFLVLINIFQHFVF
jgi:hypothetical protein